MIILVLVQPRKTCPYITERLSMGRKESNQTNKQTNLNVVCLALIVSRQLTLCFLGNFSFFFRLLTFFSILTYSKNSFRNTVRVSNSLDPDQAQHSIGPDLGPNCLQRSAADG